MPTKLGVRAIIYDNQSVVMVAHNEGRRGRFLIFPGGGIEPNESIFEAAQRETKEETGLDVKAEKIIYLRETRKGEKHGIELYVLCAMAGGKIKTGHDPEKTRQVLENVLMLSGDEINNRKDWFPDELRNILYQDIKAKFPNFRYLGLHSF